MSKEEETENGDFERLKEQYRSVLKFYRSKSNKLIR